MQYSQRLINKENIEYSSCANKLIKMFTLENRHIVVCSFSFLTKKSGENILTYVRVMKRGKVYQYQFEIASVNGTRKYKNKSGFKTKAEALEAGYIAYTEYINVGNPFKNSKLSYSDYLDYWLENYCKTKYN